MAKWKCRWLPLGPVRTVEAGSALEAVEQLSAADAGDCDDGDVDRMDVIDEQGRVTRFVVTAHVPEPSVTFTIELDDSVGQES